MRILHTSDWHLGRIFHGIHLTEDQFYVLDQFVDLVKDQKPDGIVIAGDIFDRSVPPVEAVNLLDDVCSKILMDHGVPIIMIAGNHDSPDRLGFGSKLMEGKGLNITGRLMVNREPVILYDQYGPVYFHTVPYGEPALVRERLKDESIHSHDEAMFKMIEHIKGRMTQKSRNVLVAHAFVAGSEESESERPLSVGGSGIVNGSYFKGFDYVALGHLHGPQRVGSENVRYSGSLMKYSFSEANHNKTVAMVEMDGSGRVSIENISLKPPRDLRCIKGYLKDILEGPQNGESTGDYMMITLLDQGAILDPMGKLRKVYPNTLHIERPQLSQAGNLVSANRDFRKMNEIDLFGSFIQEVTEEEMTQDQRVVFEDVLNKYYKIIREG